jgi:hypothetical protein
MKMTELNGAAKLPYRAPVLRVFGTVASITEALSPAGTRKDGGPNNTKS